ncbi:Hypothetical predicted protein [Pelobates cultripes]|uniref:Uncharacterized protein n=1 Tax=Pelobates cultripes TaxID=61616 RepID=A0AAD1SFM0_PELCU|nr:Hypothetical predicted protein [Pelobates cultripes]
MSVITVITKCTVCILVITVTSFFKYILEILVLNKQPEQISSDKRDTDITNKGTDFMNSQQIKVEYSKELLAEGKELKESVDPSVNEGDEPPSKEATMIYLSDEGSKKLLTEDKEQKESIDQSLNMEEVDQHPIKDVETIPEAPAPPVEFSKEDITDQTIDNAQDYQQQLQNGAEISLSDEGSKELLAEGKEVMESIDQSVNAEEGDQHPVKAMPEVPASEEFIKEDNTDQTIDNAQEYQQQLKSKDSLSIPRYRENYL